MGALLSFFGGPVAGLLSAYWKPIALALSVLTVVWAVHHQGYISGVQKTEKKYTVIVAKANAERDSAKGALVQTTAAFEALRVEDTRIKQQQEDAIKAAFITDKATAAKIAKIRSQSSTGSTEAERLRAIIQAQAQP